MNRPNELNSGGRDLYCCTPLCECIVGSRYEETNIGLDWRKTVLPGFLLTAFKFQEKPTQKTRNLLAKRVEGIEETTKSEDEDDDNDVADNRTKIDRGQNEDAYSAFEKKITRLID